MTSSNESQSSTGNNLQNDVECGALREIVKEYYEQNNQSAENIKMYNLL